MRIWLSKFFKSYWLRSGFFKLFERGFLLLTGFASFYVLVRYTSKEEFGTWALYLSLTTILELLRQGFISKSLMRCVGQSTSSNEYAEVETAALVLNIGLSFLTSIILLIAGPALADVLQAPLLAPLVQIYAFINLLLVAFNHLDIMQQANMDFKGSTIGQSVYKATQFATIIGYILLYDHVNLEVLVMLQGGAAVLGTLVMFYYGKKYLSLRWRYQSEAIKEMFHYGKYTFGTHASAVLLRNIDSWMLAGIIGPTAVAIYALALRVSNIFEVPTNALGSIAFPKMVEKINKEGAKSAIPLYEKTVSLLLTIMIPLAIGVLFFAEPIVEFIGEERYEDSAQILRITVLFTMLNMFNKQMGVMLDAIGKVRTNFLFVVRNTIINVVLNYIFITKFGVLGAALATFTTFLFSMLWNQWYLHRKFDVRMRNYVTYMGHSYGKAVSFFQQASKKAA